MGGIKKALGRATRIDLETIITAHKEEVSPRMFYISAFVHKRELFHSGSLIIPWNASSCNVSGCTRVQRCSLGCSVSALACYKAVPNSILGSVPHGGSTHWACSRDQWFWQNFMFSMCGIKFWKGNENLRSVYKNRFSKFWAVSSIFELLRSQKSSLSILRDGSFFFFE